MKLRCRLWIENDKGKAFFGDGRADLLAAIDASGSLAEAAKTLNMAYRTAWGHVRQMEKGFGKKLLHRKAGGKGGGGTSLTGEGRALLRQYCALQERLKEEQERVFQSVFCK